MYQSNSLAPIQAFAVAWAEIQRVSATALLSALEEDAEDLEDIAQSVAAELWQQWCDERLYEDSDAAEALGARAKRIAATHLQLRRARLRRERATSSELFERLRDDRGCPEARYAQKHLADEVGQALDCLSQRLARAIWLIDGQGYTLLEAAIELDVSPACVAMRIRRARDQFERVAFARLEFREVVE